MIHAINVVEAAHVEVHVLPALHPGRPARSCVSPVEDDARVGVDLAREDVLQGAVEGLELGPILGGEIKNPRRTIARALPIACVLVAVLYIAGTASLFLALPAQ